MIHTCFSVRVVLLFDFVFHASLPSVASLPRRLPGRLRGPAVGEVRQAVELPRRLRRSEARWTEAVGGEARPFWFGVFWGPFLLVFGGVKKGPTGTTGNEAVFFFFWGGRAKMGRSKRNRAFWEAFWRGKRTECSGSFGVVVGLLVLSVRFLSTWILSFWFVVHKRPCLNVCYFGISWNLYVVHLPIHQLLLWLLSSFFWNQSKAIRQNRRFLPQSKRLLAFARRPLAKSSKESCNDSVNFRKRSFLEEERGLRLFALTSVGWFAFKWCFLRLRKDPPKRKISSWRCMVSIRTGQKNLWKKIHWQLYFSSSWTSKNPCWWTLLKDLLLRVLG